MLLYHGSTVEVSKPDVAVGRPRLDFGSGFYTTTMPKQAEAWARRKAYEDDSGCGIVSVYEFENTDSLSIIRFKGYDFEWLEFVVQNRSNNPDSDCDYDVVIGGIADDRVIDSINYYIEEIAVGRSSQELVDFTLKQLSYQKPNDQVCFRTKKSLVSLKFIESYEVSR